MTAVANASRSCLADSVGGRRRLAYPSFAHLPSSQPPFSPLESPHRHSRGDLSSLLMVNWRDPETILHQLEAFVKVVHFVTGVYIWEFISKLNFEWSIFRGRRRRNWTAALYISCRVTTLAAAVAQMTGYNITSRISCKTWLIIVRVHPFPLRTAWCEHSSEKSRRYLRILQRHWHWRSMGCEASRSGNATST